jgi:hypothetical protein
MIGLAYCRDQREMPLEHVLRPICKVNALNTRRRMLTRLQCKDCDRYMYKLKYGEVVEPDLNTLIHGSPVSGNLLNGHERPV